MPCDTVYDPEDYGGLDAIILIAGAGLQPAGSPEPPVLWPHDVPGSQSDRFFSPTVPVPNYFVQAAGFLATPD